MSTEFIATSKDDSTAQLPTMKSTKHVMVHAPLTKTFREYNRAGLKMVFGFVPDPKIMEERAKEFYSDSNTEGRSTYDLISGYGQYAIISSGLDSNKYDMRGRKRVVYINDNHDTDICYMLADNNSIQGLRLPPPDVVEELKNLLGVEDKPRWYIYANQ